MFLSIVTGDFSENLRAARYLRHRSRIILPPLELVRRHLKVAKLFLIIPHHAPEATYLAGVADAALEARRDVGGVKNAAQVPHVVAPAPDGLLETVRGAVFAPLEKGRDHEQQRLVFE